MTILKNRLVRVSLSLIVLFTNAAFKKGEAVQIDLNLNGRSSLNFHKQTKNVKKVVEAGTIARVLDYRRLRSGNYGVQIRLNENTPNEEIVWVYDWSNRKDDIRACTNSSCTAEAPTLAASEWAQAIKDQEANLPLAEVSTVANVAQTEENPIINIVSEETAPETSLAESYSCSANAGARTCMICNCFYESRGESLKGKTAVNFVVLARANSDIYPSNICSVVYQPSQFSWTKTKRNSTIRANKKTRHALSECAQSVDYTMQFKNVTGPMWFHATRISPSWSRNMKRVTTIGGHSFYSKKGYPSRFAGELPQTLAEIQSGSIQRGAK